MLGALCWEYILDRHAGEDWVRDFEKRLHDKEAEAESLLKQFRDSVNIDEYVWEEDIVFVGFRNKKVFFWTNEIIGMDGLYDGLNTGDNFIKINNAFYEVRKKVYGDNEYFALLHIKDNYPYDNEYVKNRFGKFLGVDIENADNIIVRRFAQGGEWEIKTKEGKPLFYVQHSENFKDRSVNYLIITFYLLFFISLFYVYNLLLTSASSFRMQLLYITGFILFLLLLRYTMIENQFPGSVYRLPLFDGTLMAGRTVTSIGDLMLSAFSIVQVLYISFSALKVNYQSPKVRRIRYVIMVGLIVLAAVYMFTWTYAISSLIGHTDVHLNIARVVNVGLPSIVAFVAIIMGGVGLIIIIDGAVYILKNLLPLKIVLETVVVVMGFLAFLCVLWDMDSFSGAVFLCWLISFYLL